MRNEARVYLRGNHLTKARKLESETGIPISEIIKILITSAQAAEVLNCKKNTHSTETNTHHYHTSY